MIGKNLVRLRGEMSQKDVATAMRDRGWKWSQATVWSVERGDRPLRLAEAQDLAAILRRPMQAFLYSETEQKIANADRRLREARTELEEALSSLQGARIQMARLLDGAHRSGDELSRTAKFSEDRLRVTPEDVLREWRIREAAAERGRSEVNDQRMIESGQDPKNVTWTSDQGPLMIQINEEMLNGKLQEDS